MAKKKKKGPAKQTPVIKNKKAYFNFEILEQYEAGLVLKGTEIKSLRAGSASLGDAFAIIKRGEVWLIKSYIAPYEHGSYANHEPMRKRKLLLHKREIRKLETKIKERGFTLVPLRIYINQKGIAKCMLGLARGKKKYDKRETIKKRDVERELRRRLKN